MARRVGLLLLGAAAADGAFDNFPVKSVNLASADAISFYKLHPALVEDAHPVYGFEASSGGYIFCGKGLDSEGSSDAEAFPSRLITRLPLPVPVLGHLSCLSVLGRAFLLRAQPRQLISLQSCQQACLMAYSTTDLAFSTTRPSP